MTPRLADRHDARDYLADAAVHLLREREARYPALVNDGKLTAADAAIGLERARCLVAQWRWIIDPACPPLPEWTDQAGYFGEHNHVLATEIANAAQRARAIADRDPDSWEKRELADLYEALAWWQQPHRGGLPLILHDAELERLPLPGRPERLAA